MSREPISFHPLDLELLEGLVGPLVAGERVDPEPWVRRALRHRGAALRASRVAVELGDIAGRARPPAPPEDGGWWDRVRTRLERFDHRPDRLALRVARRFEPVLHGGGRPFLIGEGSAEHVARTVDAYLAADGGQALDALLRAQLDKLDAGLSGEIDLPGAATGADLGDRRDLLEALRSFHLLARRSMGGGAAAAPEHDGAGVELAWRAVWIHSRAVPFWSARGADGLEAICEAAGVAPPPEAVSARSLMTRSCRIPAELLAALDGRLDGERDVGAWVAPGDVGRLLDFLKARGTTIIRAAAAAGEGERCATVLRQIRECATYAGAHGMGYLEASGIDPVTGPLTAARSPAP